VKILVFILLMLMLSATAFSETLKADEPYSKVLYRNNSETLFLFLCEKAAGCLGVDAGWSLFDKIRGDGVYSCYLRGYGAETTVHNPEELLNLLTLCRANNIKLLKG